MRALSIRQPHAEAIMLNPSNSDPVRPRCGAASTSTPPSAGIRPTNKPG